MTIRIRIESLDDAPDVLEFPDLEAAIKYAREWFLGGYEQDLIDPAYLLEDARRLEDDLRNGREFYCGNFYERVKILNS